MHHLLKAATLTIVILGLAAGVGAETAEIPVAADGTLYQDSVGGLANGAGDYTFVGLTGGGSERRAVLRFDVASMVPEGMTITSASLEMTMSRTISGAQTIQIHRVTEAWTEGSSDAPGEEGGGTAAETGDVTWLFRTYDTDLWASTGGSFEAEVSGEAEVAGTGTYTWESTPELVADVQSWLDDPSSNYGWILVNSEGAAATAKRFNSKENATGSPVLTVEYSMGGEEPTLDAFTFVPAAARAAGAEGSFFLTDFEINNSGDQMATYRFLWLPRETDNSDPTTSESFTLAAGASIRYQDVLGSVFGVEDGAVGALAVISDSDELLVMSRTYNATTDGTFGQSIPGVPMADLIMTGERRRVLFFTENDDFRSNLGLLNGTGEPITIMWERFDADGESIDTGSVQLAAWSNTQLNQVFDDVAPVEAAFVDVWTETTGGAFGTYGSVLDNLTSDPTTVQPQ